MHNINTWTLQKELCFLEVIFLALSFSSGTASVPFKEIRQQVPYVIFLTKFIRIYRGTYLDCRILVLSDSLGIPPVEYCFGKLIT